MLQKLSKELKEHVILALETRQDLLHLASTCHELHDIIMPMYHLLFPKPAEKTSTPKHISFHSLTAVCFYWRDSKENVFKAKGWKLALDSLIRNCSTLVDFALIVDPSKGFDGDCKFTYRPLLKEASWCSLQRLTLTGPLELFDNKASPKEKGALAAAFFKRHPKLRCLRLEKLCDPIEPYLKEQGVRMTAIFPALKSFLSDFPVDPGLLLRLTHLSTTLKSSMDHFTSAPLLRSCVLCINTPTALEEFVKSVSIKKFARLSLHYPFAPEDGCEDCEWDEIDFDEAFDGILALIKKLRKLTHLHTYLGDGCEVAVQALTRHLADDIPSLKYCRMTSRHDNPWEWFEFEDDNASPLGEEWEEDFGQGAWGEFYVGTGHPFDENNYSDSEGEDEDDA